MGRVDKLLSSPGKLISYLTLIGIICVGIYTAMHLPKRVEAVEQDVTDLKKIIEWYYRQDQQQPYYEQPQYEPPRQRDCWDEYYQAYYDCWSGEWL